MFKLGVQLYSLREQAKLGMTNVLKMVANFGYKGVEPAGFGDLSAKEFKRIVTDLGMEISSSHGPWCRSLDDVPKAIETMGELGLTTACCGFGPADFADRDAIKRTADLVNPIQEKLAAAGITLFQHNHYWEFERLDGELKYEIYAKLAPKVKFEIDSYWSSNFGAESAPEMLKLFRDRTILLHIKDGSLCRDLNLMPLGTGKLPIPDILRVADPKLVKWVIVELDNCVCEMYNGIGMSYKYMTGTGLCAGNC